MLWDIRQTEATLMRSKTCPTLSIPAPSPAVAVAKINGAIKDLLKARRLVIRKKFERAEDALADSLPDVAGAIRAINRRERRRG